MISKKFAYHFGLILHGHRFILSFLKILIKQVLKGLSEELYHFVDQQKLYEKLLQLHRTSKTRLF